MRELPNFPRMNFDRLRHVELNSITCASEDRFDGAEDRRFENEPLSISRSLEQPAEPFRAITVEVPLAEWCRREDRIEVRSERCNRLFREKIRYDAKAILDELRCHFGARQTLHAAASFWPKML